MIDQATEYFGNRLYTEAWDTATTTEKEKALAHAERMIRALEYGTNPPARMMRQAIFEQALFLLETTASDRERIRAQQTGVRFRWVGDAREDYTGAPMLVAPEAMTVLSKYIQRRHGRLK